MTPQILLYNITNEDQKKKIKALLLRLAGMDIDQDKDSSDRNTCETQEGDMTDFSDEMLIFCFLSDGLLNQMLQGLRKAGVYIPLKAVLTPSNCMWNSYMIHREIAKEHEMMHQTRE